MTIVHDMLPAKCRHDEVGGGSPAHQVTCGTYTTLGTTNWGRNSSPSLLESISAQVLGIIIFCLKNSSAPLAQGLREAWGWLNLGFVWPGHLQLPASTAVSEQVVYRVNRKKKGVTNPILNKYLTPLEMPISLHWIQKQLGWLGQV